MIEAGKDKVSVIGLKHWARSNFCASLTAEQRHDIEGSAALSPLFIASIFIWFAFLPFAILLAMNLPIGLFSLRLLPFVADGLGILVFANS